MSIFRYNGVLITYIHTHELSDTPVYSDDGMEYLYTSRKLSVSGTINAALPPALPGEAIADTLVRVRHALSTPRQRLEFYHNTVTDASPLIFSPVQGSTVDAKNGPFPRKVNVRAIQGSQCFLVDLEYETFVQECSGSGSPPPFISHRWTETNAIDQNFYTTRTRKGYIITRADFLFDPDQLRAVVVPPIPTGFLRLSSRYEISSDGLRMNYTYVDKEQYILPPAPATEAEGDYTESTQDGAQRWGECWVRLKGAKDADRGDLLQLAIAIVVTRLFLVGANQVKGAWLAIGAIRQAMYKNEVEVRFRTKITPSNATINDVALDLFRFTDPPLGSDVVAEIPPDPGTRGTAGLGTIANILNDPCLAQSQEPDLPTQPNNNTPPSPLAPALVAFLPPESNAFTTGTSALLATQGVDSLDQGPYEHTLTARRFVQDEHVISVPVAIAGAATAVLKLAETSLKEVVEWETNRSGGQPNLPSYQRANTNVTPMKSTIDPGQLRIMGDGTSPQYSMQGRYEYAHTDPTATRITPAVPPWVDSSQTQNLATLPPAIMDRTQLDPTFNDPGQNILFANGLAPVIKAPGP